MNMTKLVSDPNYTPAAKDERVINSEIYKNTLLSGIDPYRPDTYDELLIEIIEGVVFKGSK